MLPYELWLSIFTFLDPNDLSSVTLCSKLFHDLASCDLIWKPILMRRFGGKLKFPFDGSTLEPRAKNFFLQFHRRSITKMNNMKGLVHGLEARILNSSFFNRSKDRFRDLLYWPSDGGNGMNVMCSTNSGILSFWEFVPLKTQRDFSKVLWMKRRRPGNSQTGKECDTLPFRWRKSFTIKENDNDIRCLKEIPDGSFRFITAGMDRKIRVYQKLKTSSSSVETKKSKKKKKKSKDPMIRFQKRNTRKNKITEKMKCCNLLTEIRGHSGCINTVKIFKKNNNKNKTLILTGSMDRTLRIWNIETGEMIVSLEGHNSGICSCKILPHDENQIVSVSMDDYLKTWDLEKQVSTTNSQTIYIHRMTSYKFERKDEVLVSGTSANGGYVKIYNFKEGKFSFEMNNVFGQLKKDDRISGIHYLSKDSNPHLFTCISKSGFFSIIDDRSNRKPLKIFKLYDKFTMTNNNSNGSPSPSSPVPETGVLSYVHSSRRKDFFGVYELFGIGFENGGVMLTMIDPSELEIKVNVVLNYGRNGLKPSKVRFLNEYQIASLCNMILVYDFGEYSFFRKKIKRYTSFKPNSGWSNYF